MKNMKRIKRLFLCFIITLTSFSYAQAQDYSVSGLITDEFQNPLPGVNVLIKGTSQGTITDIDGNYSIEVPEGNSILVYSMMGYETQELDAKGQTVIDLILTEDNKFLEEVVVVGYGSMKKSDLTGSIESINSEELSKRSVISADQALQGKVAGVQITQMDGTPGGGVSVKIRGLGTIGNSNPLILVDGMEVANLNYINPNDIASMEVLKDASAAIYGSRAANGVILITTKQGGKGKSKVEVSMRTGVSEVWRTLDLLNAKEFAEVQNASRAADGLTPKWDPDTLGVGTDWPGAVLQMGSLTDLNLSVTGGTNKTSYVISGGYLTQDGTMINTNYDRITLRVNGHHQAKKWLKVGNTLNLSQDKMNYIRNDDEWNGRLIGATWNSPTIPVYNEDGSYAGYSNKFEGTTETKNQVAMAEIEELNNEIFNVNGNLYAEIDFTPNLQFKSTFGVNVNNSRNRQFTPTYEHGKSVNAEAQLVQNTSTGTSWLNENILTYSNTFYDIHSFSVMAGFTQGAYKGENMSGIKRGFQSNEITPLSAGSEIVDLNGRFYESSSRSFLGRLHYVFNERYLFQATFRADGSSKFGENNRYGYFPSFSGAWRVNNERFMQNVELINNLKLRASWGQMGNDRIAPYQYAALLSNIEYYVLGADQTAVRGIAPKGLANKDIQWETITQTDIGIDIGLFQNKLSLTADYFEKNTTDMLVQIPLPKVMGLGNGSPWLEGDPYVNAGEVNNKGYELSVNYKHVLGDFSYEVAANYTAIKNKLVSLGGGQPIIDGKRGAVYLTKTEEGYPIGSFFGYVTDGLFQESDFDADGNLIGHAKQNGAEPGDIKFKDLNGDGTITDDDRGYIGSPHPDFIYGFYINLGYKGFDFHVDFQGVSGSEIYNTLNLGLEDGSGVYNKHRGILDYWTPENTDTDMPRLVWTDPNNNIRPSDRFIKDGSYLRVKNIQLGYNLPENLLSKANMSSLRMYISVQNAYTFTNYDGYDPEIGAIRDNSLSANIDKGNYPVPRMYMVGINIGL